MCMRGWRELRRCGRLCKPPVWLQIHPIIRPRHALSELLEAGRAATALQVRRTAAGGQPRIQAKLAPDMVVDRKAASGKQLSGPLPLQTPLYSLNAVELVVLHHGNTGRRRQQTTGSAETGLSGQEAHPERAGPRGATRSMASRGNAENTVVMEILTTIACSQRRSCDI